MLCIPVDLTRVGIMVLCILEFDLLCFVFLRIMPCVGIVVFCICKGIPLYGAAILRNGDAINF